MRTILEQICAEECVKYKGNFMGFGSFKRLGVEDAGAVLLERLHMQPDDPNVKAEITNWLDEKFSKLKTGHVFEHNNCVMVLLYALHKADVPYFEEIASIFASSSAVEIGELSRTARALLAC